MEEARSLATPTGPRQLDDDGQRLPFDTRHPHRWNSANSGTRYEPCTAMRADELEKLGVDPASVRDAAGTDGQTLRGCIWNYSTGEGSKQSRVSQIVGNSPSLAADKALNSGPSDIWLADRAIEDRVVGLVRASDGYSCATYVQSGRAAVDTIVSVVGKVSPSEICDRALEFTRATISKMPL
ncbi:DUF3558 family protein [Gordonia sp. (in: high G+C Gram-positive bacteria)]|uniref:DUF3558 family protein n=1 Tax=Gordonia sp. (in: high G+C Gram-positive bacteria) TaxID=84139 RepID=UPI003458AF09